MFINTSVFNPFTVFDEYMEISGYEIEESIERETSGNTKNLFLAVKVLLACIYTVLKAMSYALYTGN